MYNVKGLLNVNNQTRRLLKELPNLKRSFGVCLPKRFFHAKCILRSSFQKRIS